MPEQQNPPPAHGSVVGRSMRSSAIRAAWIVVLLPVILIFGLILRIWELLAGPRELWRSLRWRDVNPDSPTFAARVAITEARLEEAERVPISALRAFRPLNHNLAWEVSKVMDSTPRALQLGLEKLRGQARSTLTRRALSEDPTAWGEGRHGEPGLANYGWIHASTALEAACVATILDEALDTETQRRWMAGWAALTN